MFNKIIVTLALAATALSGPYKSQSLKFETPEPVPVAQVLESVQVHEAQPKQQQVEQPVDPNFLPAIEEIIFRLTNEERQRAGLPVLAHSDTMANYARIKSQDMGDRNYFGHGDPEGRLMQSMLDADGVEYTVWGENLAMLGGYELSDEDLAQMFMTNWMNSESHRANILSPDFDHIGIGVYKAGTRFYATQEFMK